MVDSLQKYALRVAVRSKIWCQLPNYVFPPELANWLLSEVLSEEHGSLTSREFEYFHACVTEVSLDASTLEFGHDWIRVLGKSRHLSKMELINSKTTTDGHLVDLLPLAAQLVSLRFAFCTRLTGCICATFLSRCTNLRELDLSGTCVFTKNIPERGFPGLPTTLQSLSIESCGLGPCECMWVQDLTALTSLNLARNHINSASLIGIRSIKGLAKLDISRTDVKFLPEFCSLKELRMDALELGPSCQSNAFNGLEVVSMQGCRLSKQNSQLDDILRCSGPTLRHLSLRDMKGLYVLDLTRLTMCESLSLPSFTTDEHLCQIAGFARLQELSIMDAHITALGVKCIASLTGLQALALNHCTIDDAWFYHIAALSSLTSLQLISTPVKNASGGFTRKRRSSHFDDVKETCLPNLIYLDLKDTNWLLEEGMSHFCGNVKTILLGGQHIQINNLKTFSYLCDLEYLRLEMSLTPRQVLKSLSACTSLTSIDISSGVTFSSKYSNEERLKGRHELMQQLYSKLPCLKTMKYNGVGIHNPDPDLRTEPE